MQARICTVSMSSTIAELADAVSFSRSSNQRVEIPEHALSGARCENVKSSVHQCLRKSMFGPVTDVCHEPIEENSVRKLSIARACPLEGPMRRSHCAAIRGRCCRCSMDQGGRANAEYLSAICHLRDNLSDSRRQRHATLGKTNGLTCSCG